MHKNNNEVIYLDILLNGINRKKRILWLGLEVGGGEGDKIVSLL